MEICMASFRKLDIPVIISQRTSLDVQHFTLCKDSDLIYKAFHSGTLVCKETRSSENCPWDVTKCSAITEDSTCHCSKMALHQILWEWSIISEVKLPASRSSSSLPHSVKRSSSLQSGLWEKMQIRSNPPLPNLFSAWYHLWAQHCKNLKNVLNTTWFLGHHRPLSEMSMIQDLVICEVLPSSSVNVLTLLYFRQVALKTDWSPAFFLAATIQRCIDLAFHWPLGSSK